MLNLQSRSCRLVPSGTPAERPFGQVWPTERWPSNSWDAVWLVGTAASRQHSDPAADVRTAGRRSAAPPCRSTPTQTHQTAPEPGIVGKTRLPWRPPGLQGTMGRTSPADSVSDWVQPCWKESKWNNRLQPPTTRKRVSNANRDSSTSSINLHEVTQLISWWINLMTPCSDWDILTDLMEIS